MGHNTDIRRFDARRSGQPLDLFDSSARRPVLRELLATPWVRRAADLEPRVRDEVEVPVEWDGDRARPSAFMWRQRRYVVDQVVGHWAVDARWWVPGGAVSRRCYRVVARGGVYDLAFDRLGRRWLLLGVVD